MNHTETVELYEVDKNLERLAQKMLKENVDINIIVQATGLTIHEIKKLKASS